MSTYKAVIFDWAEDDVEKLYSLFEEKLLGILDQFAEVKPYVLETIEELRKKDIKIGSTTGYTDKMMAIVTAKAKENGYEPMHGSARIPQEMWDVRTHI